MDSIVTDPPYELGFMGKGWDKTGIANNVDLWREALRVLKPGGHLLAFGGSRTAHRMVCAIEDAGFEVRDTIMWIYGSGFPKSKNLDGEWLGWGTALKPAHEPICMARKPLAHPTVEKNVQQYDTGALNIDGCRVGDKVETWPKSRSYAPGQIQPGHSGATQSTGEPPAGRWPANVIHDGLPHDWARFFYCAKASKSDRGEGNTHPTVKPTDLMRYLCRLVMPPGGLVLDPFMGSGSTGKAAVLEGFRFVGIELLPEYLEIARARIDFARRQGHQPRTNPGTCRGSTGQQRLQQAIQGAGFKALDLDHNK